MADSDPDPELEALPAPRRPWRVPTLVSLGVLVLVSVWLGFRLVPEAEYALKSGQPTELGDLTQVELARRHANTWVHGTGPVSSRAMGYRRPLDGDRFRIAPVEGRPELWIEVREPEGTRGEHYIPPLSFVGRLVPLAKAGLRHSELRAALESSSQTAPSRDAWLLIDGATPRGSRFVLGILAVLVAFAAFGAWGMVTLLRPVRR